MHDSVGADKAGGAGVPGSRRSAVEASGAGSTTRAPIAPPEAATRPHTPHDGPATDSARLTPQREAGIASAVAAYQTHPDIGFACCSAHAPADAVPALLAELAAVRTERDQARAAAQRDLDAHRAEVLREAADMVDAAFHGEPFLNYPPDFADLLREKAKDIREDAPAPDFFQPGHSYTHRNGSTFRCVAVTTHPDSGWRVALGWITDTAGYTFVDFRNIDHWNHEYDGVQPPAEGGDV
ncbi:hypothetical protein [Streptomyces sp. NPDC056188]|uniref:hypothetical protein n=1 Tax=Streptomyces sp. NPDC056188 TaxID=3345740 RepID=UPI0035DA947F